MPGCRFLRSGRTVWGSIVLRPTPAAARSVNTYVPPFRLRPSCPSRNGRARGRISHPFRAGVVAVAFGHAYPGAIIGGKRFVVLLMIALTAGLWLLTRQPGGGR